MREEGGENTPRQRKSCLMKLLSAWIYAVIRLTSLISAKSLCVKAHISWLSEVMNSTSRPGATPSETVVAGLFLIPFWSCGWFNKASLSGSFREPKTSVAVGGCKKRAKYTAFWRFRSDPERFCCVIKVHEENQHLEKGTKCKMKCIVVKIPPPLNTQHQCFWPKAEFALTLIKMCLRSCI